jgi:hypothetical protein
VQKKKKKNNKNNNNDENNDRDDASVGDVGADDAYVGDVDGFLLAIFNHGKKLFSLCQTRTCVHSSIVGCTQQRPLT